MIIADNIDAGTFPVIASDTRSFFSMATSSLTGHPLLLTLILCLGDTQRVRGVSTYRARRAGHPILQEHLSTAHHSSFHVVVFATYRRDMPSLSWFAGWFPEWFPRWFPSVERPRLLSSDTCRAIMAGRKGSTATTRSHLRHTIEDM